jgi:hypothetical protein
VYKGETLNENETEETNEEDNEIDPVMREEFDKALWNLKNN